MRVVVGMSGGIDSSITAYLLKKSGYDVIGLTFRFWECGFEGNDKSCCGIDAVEQAKSVAGILKIPHYVLDVRDSFEENVFKKSWSLYAQNKTPNPCAICNRFVKFPHLLRYADLLKAEYISTGHYAISENGCLYRGADPKKDQSYFLYSLKNLERIIFPLGEITKTEVRSIAKEIGLPNAQRKESQDLCFGVKNFPEMLCKRYGDIDFCGKVITKDNKILGENKVYNYTIGQKTYGNYVVELNKDIIVDKSPRPVKKIVVSDLNFISKFRQAIEIQTRYRQKAVPALAKLNGDKAEITFLDLQHSVAPGQIAVFYYCDEVIGGGTIEEIE